MANMSYCMFENTYGDLKDCVTAMQECEDISEFLSDMSEYERHAFERMAKLCKQFIEYHRDIMDAAEEVEVSPYD